MRPPGRSDAGFTLVEAMVALSLLLLLVVTINQTLGLARSMSDNADERVRSQIAETEALQVIRRDLARLADPLQFESGEREAADELSTLSGDSRSLRLTSLLSDSTTGGGHVEVTMEIEEVAGAYRLVHARSAADEEAGDTDSPAPRTLIRSPVAIAWTYLAAGEDGAPGWEESWQDRQDLPLAIALRLLGGDMPDDALIVVHPRSAGTIRLEACEEPPCAE